MNRKFQFMLTLAAFFLFAMGTVRPAHAATPQPCTLLTQAQVSKTLSTVVVAGKQEGQFDCEWDQVGWTMLKGVRLLLHVLGPEGTLTVADQFNAIKMPLPVKGITKTPLSGVGDDAVYGIVGVSAPELTVKKGNVVFQVWVQGFPRNQMNAVKAMEKTLAQDVLAKL